MRPARSSPPLLLSVDFEDWHQLVRRRVGVSDWQQGGPALERQTTALLRLLNEIGARATFFILGMAARTYPQLVSQVVETGHEIACHGDAHRPVHGQTREEFAADLATAKTTIQELTGRHPMGYRAPAFSITRESPWAYEVLADEGFAYDSSQHDSPQVRGQSAPATSAPHPLSLPGERELWEFPIAVWHQGRLRLPVGGASYWSVMPTHLVLHALGRSGPMPGLYVHPQELDPEPLRAQLSPSAGMAQRAHAGLRALQRNAARRSAPSMLRAIAERFTLIPYGEAYAQLRAGAAARS